MLMAHINKKFLISCFYLFLLFSYLYHVWLFPRLMHVSGDFEKNPGPLKDFSQTFSIGHWNLNSLSAHNFTKVPLVVAIGDFNAPSSNWCINGKCNYEGAEIDCLATEYDLKQVINESTYLLENSSSYIDVMFTSQPNLVMEAGIRPSLHASYHHQIVYAKFNLKIHYAPPYERDVWYFQKADIDLIGRAMNEFNWERVFSILISMRWYLFLIQLLIT